MNTISALSPGDLITLGTLVLGALALLVFWALRRRAARQDALIERLERRLGPANSYDMARLDLTRALRPETEYRGLEGLQPLEHFQRDHDARDRAFGQGRWEP